MAKGYLSSRGVQYTDVLVDRDQQKAYEMVAKTGQMGVPVTVITDNEGKEHIIVGFDRNRMDTALGL